MCDRLELTQGNQFKIIAIMIALYENQHVVLAERLYTEVYRSPDITLENICLS